MLLPIPGKLLVIAAHRTWSERSVESESTSSASITSASITFLRFCPMASFQLASRQEMDRGILVQTLPGAGNDA